MAGINLKKIRRVDDNLLKEIVSRIVNAVRPDKIVLFGSYAFGKIPTMTTATADNKYNKEKGSID